MAKVSEGTRKAANQNVSSGTTQNDNKGKMKELKKQLSKFADNRR